jgi:hypothetical protein
LRATKLLEKVLHVLSVCIYVFAVEDVQSMKRGTDGLIFEDQCGRRTYAWITAEPPVRASNRNCAPDQG